ncbi:pteridine reductase [Paraferrimonas sedimenticola]|uniref:Pteridine reductase n=1 Tax=Paraferrimonas sedimenticola TaxID=375674 RepID=A0AA37RV08_9GAMM|nr:pteridine reductase [Paraferrimonas sedimenticola]GLP96140.1 pteridine reductase [Paraferrimonas sedimenticola]
MSQSHESPVALVTGASKRLGAAIARRLHSDGYRLILHFNGSSAQAQALAEELNQRKANSAVYLGQDLSQLAQLASFADKAAAVFGRVDVLINNAAVFYPTPMADFSLADAEQTLAVNALAPVLLAQALTPKLNQSSAASIVNLIDIHAEKPLYQHVLYSMAKAALASATLSMAQELSPRIRVNGVAPGAILWPEQSSQEAQEQVLENIPLKRCGEPNDIADTVSFLVVQAQYINGQIINVDGGRSAMGYQGA